MGHISDAMGRIGFALKGARRPAVLWSGGKDSTALLHLARDLMPDIECIQWRLPWLRQKWCYHELVAAEWGLAVHDQLPAWSAVCHGNGRLDIMEGYAIGADAMVLARGTEDLDESRPWVCGLDWLNRPKAAHTAFPWDALLCGHKNGDEDDCAGPVPLRLDILRPPGCADVHYPLRNWTDADVTAYLLSNNIEWDAGRYELEETGDGSVLRTRADKQLNSDFYNACTRCIDCREGDFVTCPKSGLTVDNVSSRCQQYEPRHGYCGLGNKFQLNKSK